jgi:hypothetical protein
VSIVTSAVSRESSSCPTQADVVNNKKLRGRLRLAYSLYRLGLRLSATRYIWQSALRSLLGHIHSQSPTSWPGVDFGQAFLKTHDGCYQANLRNARVYPLGATRELRSTGPSVGVYASAVVVPTKRGLGLLTRRMDSAGPSSSPTMIPFELMPDPLEAVSDSLNTPFAQNSSSGSAPALNPVTPASLTAVAAPPLPKET